jgi:pimeloyl-ACP methyl ester carboxylesterase
MGGCRPTAAGHPTLIATGVTSKQPLRLRGDEGQDPRLARDQAEHVPAGAKPCWYDGGGHIAQLEEPDRFNRELAALTAADRLMAVPSVCSCRRITGGRLTLRARPDAR